MEKKRWSIIIETNAANMKEFDELHFDDGAWSLPSKSVLGIIICDPITEDTK